MFERTSDNYRMMTSRGNWIKEWSVKDGKSAATREIRFSHNFAKNNAINTHTCCRHRARHFHSLLFLRYLDWVWLFIKIPTKHFVMKNKESKTFPSLRLNFLNQLDVDGRGLSWNESFANILQIFAHPISLSLTVIMCKSEANRQETRFGVEMIKNIFFHLRVATHLKRRQGWR